VSYVFRDIHTRPRYCTIVIASVLIVRLPLGWNSVTEKQRTPFPTACRVPAADIGGGQPQSRYRAALLGCRRILPLRTRWIKSGMQRRQYTARQAGPKLHISSTSWSHKIHAFGTTTAVSDPQ